MAATFVIEDGTGKADANAYCSEAEADQYHDNFGAPAAWTGADSATKQAAIRAATRYIDAEYQGRWKGTATYRIQRLSWPRTDVEKRVGFFFDPNEMPVELKDACAQIALEHINAGTAGLQPNLAAGTGTVKSERSKVGSLETATEFMGGAREEVAYPIADGLLAILLLGSAGVGVVRRS
jgi:hypothetical protein